jgi:hypothetical protein
MCAIIPRTTGSIASARGQRKSDTEFFGQNLTCSAAMQVQCNDLQELDRCSEMECREIKAGVERMLLRILGESLLRRAFVADDRQPRYDPYFPLVRKDGFQPFAAQSVNLLADCLTAKKVAQDTIGKEAIAFGSCIVWRNDLNAVPRSRRSRKFRGTLLGSGEESVHCKECPNFL